MTRMEVIVGPPHLTDIKEVEQISRARCPDEPVTEHLQRQAANALVLFINYKHYQWGMCGPLFRSLHEMFGECAASVLSTFDEFAARLRMIGQDPVASLDEIQRKATVEPADSKESVRAMIEEAGRNAVHVIREMRQAAGAALHAEDHGAVDLFSSTVRMHEKQEWQFREILKTFDGLYGPSEPEPA
jgi:starvation-inducible DNA-binding protein